MTRKATDRLVSLLRETSNDANIKTESEVLRFSVSHQERVQIQNRIWWYGVGSWLMVVTAATVGAVFAFMLNDFVVGILDEVDEDWFASELSQPWPPKTIAPLMALIAFVATATMIGGLIYKRLPGTFGTTVAADWANVCDAVGLLIQSGTTYPNSFRAVASIVRTSETRKWLLHLAERIETGRAGPISKIAASRYTSGDSAMVAVLVDHGDQDPSAGWNVATRHFDRIARRRFELSRTMLPIFSTLVAGLLFWLSMVGTLGWMWRQILNLLRGLTGF